jgi:hypothetical protein
VDQEAGKESSYSNWAVVDEVLDVRFEPDANANIVEAGGRVED